MQKFLPEAIETSVQVKLYGDSDAVVYTTLTSRNSQGKRLKFMSQGMCVRGDALIGFNYQTDDDSGERLKEFLGVVYSARLIEESSRTLNRENIPD